MFRAPRVPRPSRPILMTIILTGLLAFPMGIVLASHQFGDVPNSNPFHGDIDALVDADVTAGCGNNNYCPKANVTREQMAAFMNRLGALAPGKTPVVNADRLDGLHANQIIRASDDFQTANLNASTAATSIMTATAPTSGGLLVTNSFNCVSFTGTTDTRWEIDLEVDGAQISATEHILIFLHGAPANEPGASSTASTLVPVAAGSHTLSYAATRAFGDGTLDCNIFTTALFVPFGDGGGLPAALPQETLDGSGAQAAPTD